MIYDDKFLCVLALNIRVKKSEVFSISIYNEVCYWCVAGGIAKC